MKAAKWQPTAEEDARVLALRGGLSGDDLEGASLTDLLIQGITSCGDASGDAVVLTTLDELRVFASLLQGQPLNPAIYLNVANLGHQLERYVVRLEIGLELQQRENAAQSRAESTGGGA